MNSEVTVTLKISAKDDRIDVSAVQSAAGEEQVLEIASAEGGVDTAVIDLPPPPQDAPVESLGSVELPPVPELDEAQESAAFQRQAPPELPPVPDVPGPETFAAFESLSHPELPPVPEVPEGEIFD